MHYRVVHHENKLAVLCSLIKTTLDGGGRQNVLVDTELKASLDEVLCEGNKN